MSDDPNTQSHLPDDEHLEDVYFGWGDGETPEQVDAYLRAAGYDPDELVTRLRRRMKVALDASPLNPKNQQSDGGNYLRLANKQHGDVCNNCYCFATYTKYCIGFSQAIPVNTSQYGCKRFQARAGNLTPTPKTKGTE